MTTAALATVKAQFSAYVDEVERTHERVTVTRNGVPVAILMSVDDLSSIEETLSILSDPELMEELRQAEQEIAEGKGVKWTDFSAQD